MFLNGLNQLLTEIANVRGRIMEKISRDKICNRNIKSLESDCVILEIGLLFLVNKEILRNNHQIQH